MPIPALLRRASGAARLWLLLGCCVAALPALADEPRLSAKSAILLDATTGQILYERDPHEPLPPASTTKVLTALIALERLDPAAKLPVSPGAAATAPSRVGLHSGDRVSAEDALYGLLLKSGNDAAEVLAEAVGGSVPGFAQLMNARARQLGAIDSHFANPHGLPDDSHVSSAYDLAVIFRYAMLNPGFAKIVQTPNIWLHVERAAAGGQAQPVMVATHNRLLGSYEGAAGGKTGFTNKARRCYVGEVERGEHRLIVAVLGSTALWEDVRNLFDYGFARYGLATPPRMTPAVLVTQAAPAAAPRASAVQGVPRGRVTMTVRPGGKAKIAAARPAPAPVHAATKPVAKPLAKTTAKPAAKPAAKSVVAAKPAAATARKPVVAPAKKPAVPERRVAGRG